MSSKRQRIGFASSGTATASALVLQHPSLLKLILQFCPLSQQFSCKGVCNKWQQLVQESGHLLFRHVDLTGIDSSSAEPWFQAVLKHIGPHIASLRLSASQLCDFADLKTWPPSMTPHLRHVIVAADQNSKNDSTALILASQSGSVELWILGLAHGSHLTEAARDRDFHWQWPPGMPWSGFVFFGYHRLEPPPLDQCHKLIVNKHPVGICHHTFKLRHTTTRYVLFEDDSKQRALGQGTCIDCIQICNFCFRANSQRQGLPAADISKQDLKSWPHALAQTAFVCSYCSQLACWTCVESLGWNLHELDNKAHIVCPHPGCRMRCQSGTKLPWSWIGADAGVGMLASCLS